MQAIARWAMRGMPQAALIAAVTALVPLLFWFSSAVTALVVLRRGMAPALPVIIAAALPSGWWWIRGDVIPLMSLLMVLLMAVVLRARMRWSEALIFGAIAGSVLIQLGVFIPPGGVAQVLDLLRQSSPDMASRLTELSQDGVDLESFLTLLIGSATGLLVVLVGVASLALARSWQAGLYNPGGFREEFHALRLTPRELLFLVIVGIAASVLGFPALGALVAVPLLVAGIALIHGIFGLKGINGLWLGALYVLLITTWPMILIVLLAALIDSFVDFRGRLGRNA
ncbi:hypothetical protein [Halomonas halocynthiae]|uniref:hypothetical protein n=1 Tax=Halomonas halocynthiae TaxID=176290 RepID=UPI00042A5F90|nr:hypothetical protein [Halomonas halocynthiae]